MSWVLSEKHSNKTVNTQKRFIIKWKSFIQEFAAGEMQGGTRMHEQVVFFPLGWTVESPDRP